MHHGPIMDFYLFPQYDRPKIGDLPSKKAALQNSWAVKLDDNLTMRH